ncbi:methyltransferase domain-containing protein [Paraglaciecola sp. 2405UD69-4]|uniref:methyltransferase domain-containing protein n=1 Tax=Paraglaciecola sp. 2405UD69-4 TaxID=3391836 RepID=UPI0039C91DF6
MKPALITTSPSRPESWQDLPVGEHMKALIESEVEDFSRKFFGYHLVRLGNLSSEIELKSCPIKHQVNITPHSLNHSNIVAKPSSLPITENSVDAFILANELDFSRDPHQVLREVDRAIIPNGYVVITGFNPFSMSGLCKYLPINKASVLHEARYFSCARVKDWLQLLGFEIVDVKHLMFNELFLNRKCKPSSKVNLWCQQYLSAFTTMYLIVARKREIPLSMIKPKWKASKFSTVGVSVSRGAMQVETPLNREK